MVMLVVRLFILAAHLCLPGDLRSDGLAGRGRHSAVLADFKDGVFKAILPEGLLLSLATVIALIARVILLELLVKFNSVVFFLILARHADQLRLNVKFIPSRRW